MRILLISPSPELCSASDEITSIGTGLSATVRLAARVPVTTTVLAGSSSGTASCGVAPSTKSVGGGVALVCACAEAAKASVEAVIESSAVAERRMDDPPHGGAPFPDEDHYGRTVL
ncbi:hypothetical protein [Sphingomonas sp. S2-65]|uniref:hypothetical protein n=1 Tax=Sphingomonas sp. S2-65 TaxID=2903960 RepID=UPI001F1FBF39|nr:hypothetical protein [Sphingomonas sp. S2-65]UYY59766.1 hypothetical protein LZ586_06690 [Sphingomonas sp. S2-65]